MRERPIANRKHGWLLVEYSWDESTGDGTFMYERQREDFDAVEERVVTRQQLRWLLN